MIALVRQIDPRRPHRPPYRIAQGNEARLGVDVGIEDAGPVSAEDADLSHLHQRRGEPDRREFLANRRQSRIGLIIEKRQGDVQVLRLGRPPEIDPPRQPFCQLRRACRKGQGDEGAHQARPVRAKSRNPWEGSRDEDERTGS